MKKLALVLGGGASKGYAHIGVLQVLEAHGIKPDLIVGTSMGAVVGGMYASEQNADHLALISKEFTRSKLMDFNIFNLFKHTGILSGKKLRKVLTKQLGAKTHEQLSIPFIAISADLQSGKLIKLKEGSVVDNILASTAIPGVFPLIEKDGMQLCDGGVLNNVPDDIARRLHKDYIVLSIDVIANYSKQVETNKLKIMGVTVNALTLMQTYITKLQGDSSDLRINISQPDVLQMSFDKESIEKSIKYGKTAMQKNITKLKNLLKN